MEEMAALDRLALAEKFHMDEVLLKALNPGKPFDNPGTTIVVANIKDERPKEKVGKLVVEKSAGALRALGPDGKLLAYYPASIGIEKRPAPSGSHEVERVAENPSDTYNPKYQFKGAGPTTPFTIKSKNI
jgi:lipoprotein-anchoring transpeptidase ErfK/SrfK